MLRVKKPACNEGDLGSVPGLRRSPGERNGYLLQYSGLENSMDCIVHEVAERRTQLSDFHCQYLLRQLNLDFKSLARKISYPRNN